MINKVILLGRLGRDPEIRELPNGKLVANVSLATSEVYTDKITGEKKENTEWHYLELWDRNAEVARQYLRKGAVLYVEGRIKTDKYKDAQTGEEKQRTKIRVLSMQMLGANQGAPSQEFGSEAISSADFPKSDPGQDPQGNDQGADELPF